MRSIKQVKDHEIYFVLDYECVPYDPNAEVEYSVDTIRYSFIYTHAGDIKSIKHEIKIPTKHVNQLIMKCRRNQQILSILK